MIDFTVITPKMSSDFVFGTQKLINRTQCVVSNTCREPDQARHNLRRGVYYLRTLLIP
jgi:hypothetical protein